MPSGYSQMGLSGGLRLCHRRVFQEASHLLIMRLTRCAESSYSYRNLRFSPRLPTGLRGKLSHFLGLASGGLAFAKITLGSMRGPQRNAERRPACTQTISELIGQDQWRLSSLSFQCGLCLALSKYRRRSTQAPLDVATEKSFTASVTVVVTGPSKMLGERGHQLQRSPPRHPPSRCH
jgi:hypothetical protein